MEPEVVKRRGRKRKRKDGEDVEKTAKKSGVPPRSKVFVGKYVKKEFDDSGEFLGKIVSYETGLYRVDYEDGDCEDLESHELKQFIVNDDEMDAAFHKRKKSLDEYIAKKYAKSELVKSIGFANTAETVKKDVKLANADKVETVRNDNSVINNCIELANSEKVESSIRGGAFELSGAQPEIDSESSSDFSDYEQQPDNIVEVESQPLGPPPQLLPSSRNFGIPEEHVSYLLSVYTFLRSFSVCLFLSPFGLDEFVGALNSSVHNTLMDAIHVALMRPLKSHVEILSSEGSELASKCFRSMDWSLLDSLTWPVFIVQYITTMRYTEGPEWKEFYVNVLEKDYYTLSAGQKLAVLQLLCDDASNSAELRAEIDMREESEVGPDSDKSEDFVKNVTENHIKTPNSSVSKSVGITGSSDTGADVDDDGNGDECRLCGMDGTLVCCDGCPSSYHSRCIGVLKSFIPEGEWYCPECTINRNGPKITKKTGLKGAEFFGIDPYEQVFLGSCDHLLVMKTSKSLEVHTRYYSSVDIQKVVNVLTSSAEYRIIYTEICKNILQYWEIPENILFLNNDLIEIDKREIDIAPNAIDTENCKELGFVQPSENGNGEMTNKPFYKKEANLAVLSSEEKLYMDSKLYTGSSFKPQVYTNVYIHGDFAASAGASLAILSSEEKLGSQIQPSNNHRKFMSANYSLQAKAFSLAAKRFYWPNYEKKLVEFSRERCGWCLSCKSTISSKRGCLLNAAAANAIKGSGKILANLKQPKNSESSLASIATYVMFMEESLYGLTVGNFLNGSYRIQWRKKVEDAASLGEIKAYLLEFEKNVRDIAFSSDWIKLVDDLGFENQITQNIKNVIGPTKKRGPGRRGRKPSIITTPEITDSDVKDTSTVFAWWRGGMLSKHIFQKAVLPQIMIKNAARQGGCGKINGVHYVDGLEIPKRSRQFLWRAAVDMSKTASQLALQVRYLDLHVRWNELVCPEQPLQDTKGPEAEASAFRNGCIIDKKNLGNKIIYGVVFENQKHIPSRVLKKVLEIEETREKKEKNWFVEAHIPLYLIKDYEMKMAKMVIPTVDNNNNNKHVTKLSSLHKKRLKGSGKNIFSFLLQKMDTSGRCFCTSCHLDVPFRVAAMCSACQGYCHEQCAVGSNTQISGRFEFIFTCKRCYIETKTTPKNEIIGDSPTSPLLLQKQESQHPPIIVKIKQNGHEKPLEYSNQSSKKTPKSNFTKINKIGKQNGQNSNMNSKQKSSKSKSSSGKLVLGLIWKRRSVNETGIDFRINNILLKNNPNGHLVGPTCHLCTKPYNSDLMYIKCEKCNNWFHGDSVELEESQIRVLYGFKCCRCRRIRIPICPYTDPETRKRLEAKKAAMENSYKQRTLESDSDSETNNEQLNVWETDSTPVFDSEEAVNVNVPEEYPFYSFPTVDQVNSEKVEVESGFGPKKLPVRRHMKPEKEPAFEIPANYAGNNGESSGVVAEWDVPVPANGYEDDMMFDYEDLNYEDMEFEPQTYFSFNELLASDDNVQPNQDLNGNTVNPCAPSVDDCNPNPDDFQMDFTFDQQEPVFSVESGLEMVPCRVCSLAEPCPDLFCQTCGLWIHQHCSPWGDEYSSWEPEIGWKCGNCKGGIVF